MAIMESLPFFYMSAFFVLGEVLGIVGYRQAARKNLPFVEISFAMLIPMLLICAFIGIIFAKAGIKILLQIPP